MTPQQQAAETARIDAYVETIVAAFPPLTDRQLDIVGALLRDGAPERRVKR
jgi:hypothetical protein